MSENKSFFIFFGFFSLLKNDLYLEKTYLFLLSPALLLEPFVVSYKKAEENYE